MQCCFAFGANKVLPREPHTASYPAVRTMDDGGNHKSKHMHTRTTTTEEQKVLGKSKSFDECSTKQTHRLNPHLKPLFYVQLHRIQHIYELHSSSIRSRLCMLLLILGRTHFRRSQ